MSISLATAASQHKSPFVRALASQEVARRRAARIARLNALAERGGLSPSVYDRLVQKAGVVTLSLRGGKAVVDDDFEQTMYMLEKTLHATQKRGSTPAAAYRTAPPVSLSTLSPAPAPVSDSQAEALATRLAGPAVRLSTAVKSGRSSRLTAEQLADRLCRGIA